MLLTRKSSVVIRDLRKGPEPPSSFRGLIEEQIREIDQEDGVVRPWNVVLICVANELARYQQLLDSILTNGSQPKVILFLIGTQAEETLRLPNLLQEQRARCRVIFVGSMRGCEWEGSGHLPTGFIHWTEDPDGEANLRVLVNTLRDNLVYSRLFEATSERDVAAWSIGTKQSWFGHLPTRAIADVLHEACDELVGEAENNLILGWADDWHVPPELCGEEDRSDLLLDEPGMLGLAFRSLRERMSRLHRMLGTSGRQGAFRRVAEYPEHQQNEIKEISKELIALDDKALSLLRAIDPWDGIDLAEQRRLRAEGVSIEQDDKRLESYHAKSQMLDLEILRRIKHVFDSGYNLTSLEVQLGEVVERIQPRTREEIEQEYEKLALSSEAQRLTAMLPSAPSGQVIRIGRMVARILQPAWSRVLLVLTVILLAGGAVVLAVQDGSNGLLDSLPDPARSLAARASILVLIGVILATAALVSLFFVADEKIRAWGRRVRLRESASRVETMKRFLERAIWNEWVLHPVRRKAAEHHKLLLDSLKLCAEDIRRLMHNRHDDLERELVDQTSTNPAVLRDLDIGETGTYAQRPQVVKLLKKEVTTRLKNTLELKMPSLGAVSAEKIPAEIAERVSRDIDHLIMQVARHGPLSPKVEITAGALDERQKLIENYWTRFDRVREAVKESVLLGADSGIIQFIRPSQISSLDQSGDAMILVRFAPEASRKQINAERNGELVDLVYTNETVCAGVVRLSAFRTDFVSFGGATQLDSESSGSSTPDFQ